jgi:thymidylate synthase (FAD)
MTERLIEVGGGLVELVDVMGDAVTVVNAARVSMGRHVTDLGEADRRLLRYLWEHEHTSPFRHVTLQFRIKAPVFVLRQWMKHQVGCAWNEISGRYVTFKDEVWLPQRWRAQSAKLKQGSEGPLDDVDALAASLIYQEAVTQSLMAYHHLLRLGVAKEQARLILPLSLMSECYWTASLHAVIHFLKLRLDLHAQEEIRDFARAVEKLVRLDAGMDYILDIADI